MIMLVDYASSSATRQIRGRLGSFWKQEEEREDEKQYTNALNKIDNLHIAVLVILSFFFSDDNMLSQ